MGSTLKVDNIVGTSGTSAPITLSGDTATLGSGVTVNGATVLNTYIGFHARLNASSGTIAANTWLEAGSGGSGFGSNKWTATVNVGSVFNADTGRFTPTQAGVYLFTATLELQRLDSGQNLYVLISKNGEQDSTDADCLAFERQHMSATNNGLSISLSGIGSMNGSSDYASIQFYQSYGNTTVRAGTRFAATFLGTT